MSFKDQWVQLGQNSRNRSASIYTPRELELSLGFLSRSPSYNIVSEGLETTPSSERRYWWDRMGWPLSSHTGFSVFIMSCCNLMKKEAAPYWESNMPPQLKLQTPPVRRQSWIFDLGRFCCRFLKWTLHHLITLCWSLRFIMWSKLIREDLQYSKSLDLLWRNSKACNNFVRFVQM